MDKRRNKTSPHYYDGNAQMEKGILIIKSSKKWPAPNIIKMRQQQGFILYAKDLLALAVNTLFNIQVNAPYNIRDGTFYNRYQFGGMNQFIIKNNPYAFT